MNTTLLIIGLLLLFAWYVRDRFMERKGKLPAPGNYRGVVRQRPAYKLPNEPWLKDNAELTTSPTTGTPPGRLYYGIPGRSFQGYIWNGRIITRKK